MEIIGRKREQQLLQEAFDSNKAELIALYGRRRVGKTYLIKNFFDKKKCIFVYVSGIKNGSLREQLDNFINVLKVLFIPGLGRPKNWKEAFTIFNQLIEKITLNSKIVLFLDELPWLATRRSGLLEALDYFWNRHWSHDQQIKIVICGSAASWMLNKIIYNKGGLYNRVTCQFRLEPFLLKETKEFLKANKIHLTNSHIVELYMATGGIPFYLSKIRKGLSAAQNIDELAFSKEGLLYQDFDILFSSLFDDADDYVKLIRVIANNRYGILQEELLKQSKTISSGGRAKEKLRNLEEAGFIFSSLVSEHKRKGIYYRLIDEYSYFYLKWIEPFKKSAKKFDKTSWLGLRTMPTWHAWAGYAFEMLCMKHIAQIREALKLPLITSASTWKYEGKAAEQGVQIDLLFDRPDDAVTICEIKYTDSSFVIDKEYYRKLINKIEVYKKVTKTNKQIFLVLISAAGLKQTVYANECLHSLITLDELFT